MNLNSALKKDNNSDQKSKSLEIYSRLIGYIRPYWYMAVSVLLLSLLTSLIAVLPAQITGIAIDEINQLGKGQLQAFSQQIPTKESPSLSITPLVKQLSSYASHNWMPNENKSIVTFYVLAVFFVCLHLITSGISISSGLIGARLGQKLIFDMRSQVYQHLQKLSLGYFHNHSTGDLISRTVNDVNSLQNAILEPVIAFTTNVFTLFWVLYLCLSWDCELTLLSLSIAPFLGLAMFIFGRKIRKVILKVRQKIGELTSFLQENLSGIAIIKGFVKEKQESIRFDKKNKENMDLNVKVAIMYILFSPMMKTLSLAGALFILLYGGIKVVNGEMTPGIFVVFFSYIRLLYRPITGLSGFYQQIQTARASAERIFEVLDTVPDIKNKENAYDVPQIRGEIEFRDVYFSYSNNVDVLKNINLKALPGKMIAFVGASGVGKTTIINLVPRFYDPTKGDIFVDGHNVKDIKIESFRRQIGMVLQEPFLFNDTIKNNILYGRDEATDEEIINSAIAANAHDFIMQLPDGYNTIIGERGSRLSAGQRQRISIARAILMNPRILILDEATSSVDTETESLIQDAIQKLVRDRTTFVIAHRLSTIYNADLIIVLENGTIAESGTHDELLTKGGIYKRLYDAQFKYSSDEKELRVQIKPARQTQNESESVNKIMSKINDMLQDDDF